jgi:predicted transcriptional regulator
MKKTDVYSDVKREFIKSKEAFDVFPPFLRELGLKMQEQYVYFTLFNYPHNKPAKLTSLAKDCGCSESYAHEILLNLVVKGLVSKCGNIYKALLPGQNRFEAEDDYEPAHLGEED